MTTSLLFVCGSSSVVVSTGMTTSDRHLTCHRSPIGERFYAKHCRELWLALNQDHFSIDTFEMGEVRTRDETDREKRKRDTNRDKSLNMRKSREIWKIGKIWEISDK